jgi:uncharacterized protein
MTASAGMGAEWPWGLDIAAEVSRGWQPIPFRQFVLKLNSRCDLACDYCYMFTMADQGWRSVPRTMPQSVVDQTCVRIAEHTVDHGLTSVQVVLHGGEPLLRGPEAIGHVATTLRRSIPSDVKLDLRVQTNGTRLDETMLRTLSRHQIRVGVSLDGDQNGNDRHRRYPNGRGSFGAIRDSLLLLNRQHPELFTGLLCTIDLRNDPVITYQALLEFRPPAVDFLLPHGNWSTPPPGRHPTDPATPYGDWLAAVFDRWYAAARQETEVRLLAEMVHLILGGSSHTEAIGLSPVAVVVVNVDGAIEQVDTLRSSYAGAVATSLNVFAAPFDAALTHPGVVARQIGLAALADRCQDCRVRRICGGGYYPHRYRRGTGFRNPSVYSADLMRLIDHVTSRIQADLATIAGRSC